MSIDLSLEAELLPWKTYERRFTVFKLGLFYNPVMYPLARIQLAKFPTLHYIPTDALEIGPQVGDNLIQSVPGIKYIEHITELKDPIGSPIKNSGVTATALTTDYRMGNRIIRQLGNSAARVEGAERDVVIYNYGMVSQMWRYPANFRSAYHAWYNVMQVVVDNLSKVARNSSRIQYLTVGIPDVIPSLSDLRLFSKTKTSETLKELRSFDDYTVADLFVWSGKYRDNSVLGKIPSDLYPKINLLLRRNDRWTVVNLGFLNGLIRSEENKQGMEAAMFELRMLHFLNMLHDAAEPINLPTVDIAVDDVDLLEEGGQSDRVDGIDEVLDTLDLGFNINEDEVRAADFNDLEKLEKELEELDKLKDVAVPYETTDDDGNVIENTANKLIEAVGKAGSVKSDTVGMVERAEQLVGQGSLSAREYQRLLRLSDRYATLPDPYGSGKSIVEAGTYSLEDTYLESEVISTDPVVLDPSMARTTIDQFEKNYITQQMNKDYINIVGSLRRAPVAVMDHRVEKYEDASNKMGIHIIKLTPAIGEGTSAKIPIPIVEEDGTFLYNGTRYRQKKQRRDMPIRKISPTDVVLSNIAGNKVFIRRAERSRFNRAKSLLDATKLLCAREGSIITDASVSKVVDYTVDLPWMYTTMASEIAGFTVKGFVLNFDYRNRIKINHYTDAELKLEKKGWVLVGREKSTNAVLIMDNTDRMYRRQGDEWVDIGSMEDLLEIDARKQGIPMAELKIYSSVVPIGVALGYLIGLSSLLTLSKVKHRRVLPGERQNLSPEELAIRFKNEVLIINTRNPLTTMIMSGWLQYQETLRDYDIKLFDSRDVYTVALERNGVSSWMLKELDMMNMMFIDPITEDLLKMMNEPTDYVGLLVRATELILKEYVPSKRRDSQEVAELYERVSGYDRFPGAMYDVLYKAMRSYMSRSGSGRASIVVNPNDVVNKLVKDGTVAPVNNINATHSMREREVITFGGDGGRSRRAMVASTRLYPETDKGFITEASVDSGDVGIITYLAPNANIRSIRGTVRLYDAKRDGVGMLLSTPAQLAPCADGEDLKRVGFISTQAGHRISIEHGETQACRTGGERLLINRVSPEFGYSAKEDGVVTELNERAITVKLKSGKELKLPLGLFHTNAEGSHYPNTIVPMVKLGDKFKKEDVITYNENAFKPSPLGDRRVDLMQGTVGFLAFREATYTYEDSSSISAEFGERLVAKTSKPKTVSVGFDQIVSDLVKVGDMVDLNSPLCVIENYVGDDESFYDEKTRNTLREFAKQAPPAKIVGVVAGIEVRYNGDPELMSDSLRKITTAADRERKRSAEALGKPYHPGLISRFERIDGHHVEENNAVIIIHVINTQGMTVGDKLVVANQLKSTVGEMLFGKNTTEMDDVLDGIFGAISVLNRIVTSVFKIGPVNTYMRRLGEAACNHWNKK